MSRLPIPGSDDGSWGAVLNDFLVVSHNTDGSLLPGAITSAGGYIKPGSGVPSTDLSTSVQASLGLADTSIQKGAITAKGDLIAATAANTVTRLGVGSNGQVLTADSTQTSGILWAAPATNATPRPMYPLSAYGFHSASTDIDGAGANSTLVGGFFTRVFVPAGNAIHAIGTIVHIAGTVSAGGINGFAVYDDSGVFVAVTTNDNSQWASTGWIVKTFASPIAAQGVDRFVYAVAACHGYSSQPYIQYVVANDAVTDGGGYLVNNRRSFYANLGSWPGTVNPATFGNPGAGYIPLITLG